MLWYDGSTYRQTDLDLGAPNGAGKTTFARELLATEADYPTFLNADIIAAELSPQHPEQVAVRAARLMLERIREEVATGGASLSRRSSRTGAMRVRFANGKAAGYHVALWFVALSSAEAALARVAQPVL